MAQFNPTVGAVAENAAKIIHIIKSHQNAHDLIIFPELALTGYPPEDLLLRQELFAQVNSALKDIEAITKDCHVILGYPSIEKKQRYNSLGVIANGKLLRLYHKQYLPNYGVFDEVRYFHQGKKDACIIKVKNKNIGLCICEDIWAKTPVEDLIAANASIIVCINASPFDTDKYQRREQLVKKYAKQGIPFIYVNQVGGQDELVFDGQSFVVDAQGEIVARAKAFAEDLQTVTIENQDIQGTITPALKKEALIYQALLCGLNDYVEKNHFPGVLLGLSGGIDSALALCLAVDALGADRVHAVLMPSRYTAKMSVEDAEFQANAMRVDYLNLSIEPAFNALLSTLAPPFKGLAPDVTEENLQSRIRALLLMALSNKKGYMLLSTSNKSETAVGYTTLYGDMCGGFAVLKDVLKTRVYDLAHYRNSLSKVIPERVLTRAPSAELAPNQKDEDSLPPYAILDGIITAYMENNQSVDELIQQGYAAADVIKVIKLIKRNEYKRRQAPPGVKITPRGFNRDWRYPITSGFKG
jgi:NAD+ synthase (glutamine-hydrolysing)